MIKQFIEIKTDFEGIHRWDKCNIEEVMFLKYPHRHKIYIVISITTNKDRQIEFFMFKKEIDDIIDNLFGKEKIKKLDNLSMENIGKKILNELLKNILYTQEEINISVSEDNQVSAIIKYQK